MQHSQLLTELLEKAAQKTRLHANVTPNDKYFSKVSLQCRGFCSIATYFCGMLPRVELFIVCLAGAEENERIFDQLIAQRRPLSPILGEPIGMGENEGVNPC